jgi:hypothetical protein
MPRWASRITLEVISASIGRRMNGRSTPPHVRIIDDELCGRVRARMNATRLAGGRKAKGRIAQDLIRRAADLRGMWRRDRRRRQAHVRLRSA